MENDIYVLVLLNFDEYFVGKYIIFFKFRF